MSAVRVGLTGGIASGKSTVARRLAEAGFTVIDADRLVAELYRPGEPGARAVAEQLGTELLAADGSVDKAAVGRFVFADPAALARLESAVHPLVRQRFSTLATQAGGVAILEATKLIEAGFAPDFDLIVTVEADEALRIARAVARGLPEAEVRARIAAQAGEAERRRAATVVIENDSTRAALLEQTDQLIARLRTLSSSARTGDRTV